MVYVFKVADLLEWLSNNDLTRYWYGTHGHKCTEDLLQRKRKQYPSHYAAERMANYRKHIAAGDYCADCVGAIKYAFWSNLGKSKQVYGSNHMPDVSADGLFRHAKGQGCAWGTINTIPERPGIAVRFAGHVGYYMGKGIVREWRGYKYGRVDTQLANRPWTHWYELPYVDYADAAKPEDDEPVTVGVLGSRLLKRSCKGADVAELQRILMELGYPLKHGDDGDYGIETEGFVRELQSKLGLMVDGKYGEKSHAALMSVLAEMEDPEDAETEIVEPKCVEITGGSVNVRSGAGTQHEIITRVHKGDLCVWRATAANGWHAVILPGGREGWVSPKYSKVVV